MYLSGNNSAENGIDSINDLERLRSTYFVNREALQFYDLYLAPSCNKDSILKSARKELDPFIIDLAGKLNAITKNLIKIKTYIYNDRFDLQSFLGIPQEFKMLGLNVKNVIHNYKYDLKVIKHETAHNFILQKIGDNTSNFFAEGFRQYTDYLFDDNSYKQDLHITLEHIDLLTPDLLQRDIFYTTPLYYPISGVFVKHIIDKIGLEEFKKMYSDNQIVFDLKTKYNLSLEQLIEEFKEKVKK